MITQHYNEEITPLVKEIYKEWTRHKAQAKYRNEEYELSFIDYLTLWSQDNRWANRGRKLDTNVNMVRKDPTKSWVYENIHFITYLERVTQSGKKTSKNKKKNA